MGRLPEWCDFYFWQSVGEELFASLIRWVRKRPVTGAALGLCVLLLCVKATSLIIALLFSGSSAEVTNVEGHISIRGVPVQEGTLQFVPQGNGQAASAVIKEGWFKAKKVPVGSCRVICVAITETGKTINEGGHSFPERVSLVPEAYRDGTDLVIQPRHGELLLEW